MRDDVNNINKMLSKWPQFGYLDLFKKIKNNCCESNYHTITTTMVPVNDFSGGKFVFNNYRYVMFDKENCAKFE
jgi:hypothetical protein